jgi:hypothetical protein
MTYGRVDANHALIVRGLRQVGASVEARLAAIGFGCPDLACGFRGVNYLFEVKNGVLKPSARQLTENERIWHMNWQGQVDRIETLDEALKIIGVLTK